MACDMSPTLHHSTALLQSMALCAGNLASSSIAGLPAQACCLRCWPDSDAVAGASMITSRSDAASCCHSCAKDSDMAGGGCTVEVEQIFQLSSDLSQIYQLSR